MQPPGVLGARTSRRKLLRDGVALLGALALAAARPWPGGARDARAAGPRRTSFGFWNSTEPAGVDGVLGPALGNGYTLYWIDAALRRWRWHTPRSADTARFEPGTPYLLLTDGDATDVTDALAGVPFALGGDTRMAGGVAPSLALRHGQNLAVWSRPATRVDVAVAASGLSVRGVIGWDNARQKAQFYAPGGAASMRLESGGVYLLDVREDATVAGSGFFSGFAPPHMGSLRGAIENRIAAHAGTAAFAVTDLETGERMAVNGDERIVAASTIKLAVLLAVLRDVEAGRYTLASVDPLLDAMIGESSNAAAAELVERTGIENLNAVMDAIGMERSVFSHWPAGASRLVYSRAEEENYLTATETADALARLHRGEVFTVDSALRDVALAKLRRETYARIIPRHLPPGVDVAHKAGWLPWGWYSTLSGTAWQEAHNDAGIVSFGNGDSRVAFAVAYLSQQSASHEQAAALGADLTKLTYDHFVQRAGAPAGI